MMAFSTSSKVIDFLGSVMFSTALWTSDLRSSVGSVLIPDGWSFNVLSTL